jgi:glycosyltransferase involved in cell wall biosynthesis
LVRRFGLCENYEAVISFTPAQQEFLVGEMGISSNRISYIPYSVDEEFFCFSKGAEDGYVLTVGGVPGRDYSTFAEALRNTQYDVKMVLGGRSDGRNTAIGVGGIPPTFEIYSRLSSVDMRDLYRGASVVVVPLTRGRADAAGSSVLLEAMSSGRPVVLSATPGISPYAEHGVTGLLVEPGSPQALREAVDRLMMDHSLRTAIGEEGRAFVERKLTLRQYVDRLRKVIGGGRVCWPLGEPKEVAS